MNPIGSDELKKATSTIVGGVRWNEYVDRMVNAAAIRAAEEGEIDAGYSHSG